MNKKYREIEGKKLNRCQEEAVYSRKKIIRVVASAGSGKTYALLNKVINELEQGINPKEILLITFSSPVRHEMKERLKKLSIKHKDLTAKLELVAENVHTFHSYCLKLMRRYGNADEKDKEFATNFKKELGYKESGDPQARYLDHKVLRDLVYKNEEISQLTKKFFQEYMFIDTNSLIAYEFDQNSKIPPAKIKTIIKKRGANNTINNLRVRSYEEKAIAEYLHFHNIKFNYEDTLHGYPGIPDFRIMIQREIKINYSNKRMRRIKHGFLVNRSRFENIDIWFEHFGLDENMNPPTQYDKEYIKKYKISYDKKIKFMEEKKYNFIKTYSYQHRKGNLFKILDNQLKEICNKYDLTLPEIESDEKILGEYINDITYMRFSKLMADFMNNFRTRELKFPIVEDKINNLSGYEYERSNLFFKIFRETLSKYEEIKKDEDIMDFVDMIIIGKKYIENENIKRLIVDEFQDTSQLFAKICKELIKHNEGCNFFVVGDDGQTIYGFQGSDIKFIGDEFGNNFGKGKKIHTEKFNESYRFNTAMAQLSSAFIAQNPRQIPKPDDFKGRDFAKTFIPLQIINVGKDYRHSYELTYAIKKKLDIIFRLEKDVKKIWFLSRYSPSTYKNEYSSLKENLHSIFSSKKDIIQFSTIHKSKGGEADYIFLMNVNSRHLGFPCDIEDDKILELVRDKNDKKNKYEEERRLFYVAITRVKKKVFMFTEEEGVFFKEIKNLDKIYKDKHYQLRNLEKLSNPKKELRITNLPYKIVVDGKLQENRYLGKLKESSVIAKINGKDPSISLMNESVRNCSGNKIMFEINYGKETNNISVQPYVKEYLESEPVYKLPFNYKIQYTDSYDDQLKEKYGRSRR